jgi:iron complex outermembrane receptor protein
LTAGAVFTPHWWNGIRLSATYWRIEQQSRIQLLNPIIVLANEASVPFLVTRAAPTAADIAAGLPGKLIAVSSINSNFGDLHTDGIDFEVRSTFETSIGSFMPSLLATWVDKYRVVDFPGTPSVNRVGIANSQGTIPRWRLVSTLDWTHGGIGATATGRLVSSYADVNNTNVLDGLRVGTYFLLDLQAHADIGELAPGHPWSKGLQLTVGAINALNRRPPFSEVASVGFDPSEADTRQRFLYVSLSKHF